MRYDRWMVGILLLAGCVPHQATTTVAKCEADQLPKMVAVSCVGDTALPTAIADQFEPVDDAALLGRAKGLAGKGGLCKGAVYKANPGVKITLYRAWNGTNSHSRKGKWWAFSQPQGSVMQYRSDYEICYNWSPLDRMTHCQLKPGALIVVGPGQSAVCDKYLNYPVSPKQQVYLENADQFLDSCEDFIAQRLLGNSWLRPICST